MIFICDCILSEARQISSVFTRLRFDSRNRRSLNFESRMPKNQTISEHFVGGDCVEVTTRCELTKRGLVQGSKLTFSFGSQLTTNGKVLVARS